MGAFTLFMLVIVLISWFAIGWIGVEVLTEDIIKLKNWQVILFILLGPLTIIFVIFATILHLSWIGISNIPYIVMNLSKVVEWLKSDYRYRG